MKSFKKSICLLLLSLLLISPTSVTAETNNFSEDIYVTIGGEPFGIKMYTDGVYILKTESFEGAQGNLCCPAEDAGIKSNDIIREINDCKITSNEELKTIINESKGNKLTFEIERNEEMVTLDITPMLSEDGTYKTGMWIKDSAAGLGTISFYSEQSGSFCGLGHGMIDDDTKELIPMTTGDANFANVSSVTKSTNGNVGTLNGYFLNEKIGNFNINTESGIYGKLTTENLKDEKILLGNKDEVKRGAAKIYTTIEGQTPDYYDVEIIMIKRYDDKINLIIKITDERLLNITGGIVQGMSGSPIIQNDMLIGVLTHVVVNNVNYGYGIFAETMYEKMNEIR